jgi:hypothetical protein
MSGIGLGKTSVYSRVRQVSIFRIGFYFILFLKLCPNIVDAVDPRRWNRPHCLDNIDSPLHLVDRRPVDYVWTQLWNNSFTSSINLPPYV